MSLNGIIAAAKVDVTAIHWMQVHGEKTDEVAATNDLVDLLTGGLGASVS